ncbi:MAG TPA: PHP domain-containing protein [Gaiellaceae bacterium]|nr:PHP domain-containing protein [Gaiellaceae bacterium]
MPEDLTNAEIADRLSLYAALLELADRNPYAIRSYLRAAETIRTSPASISELVQTGRVRELRGIGAGIDAKLQELVRTGELSELRALEAEISPELVGYARSLGVSADRMLRIARDLDVATVSEFREAVSAGRLQDATGVGPATEARIRSAMERGPGTTRGLTVDRSRALSERVAVALGGVVAGPARRYCELAHELVVVVPAEDATTVLERSSSLSTIVAVLEREDARAVGLTVEGVAVRVCVAPPDGLGTELFRATGSGDYVNALEPLPTARSEDEIFGRLGLPFCPPECRERAGDQAPAGLVAATDVRGDLHCHTTWSDGRASVHEMARAARARGYDYLAICDHTPNVRVVPGLGASELARQAEEIAAVNEAEAPFRVLRGLECDIRPDGSLDADDRILDELDWVQLSLHAGQRRTRSELTRLVTHAMRHPAVRALSHPTGRILNHRPENALDLDAVFEVALETGVAIEVNGLPDRLDLSAEHVSDALAAGVDLVLNSDAHSEAGLGRMELALATARKGGAVVGSVLNTRPLDRLLRSGPSR